MRRRLVITDHVGDVVRVVDVMDDEALAEELADHAYPAPAP